MKELKIRLDYRDTERINYKIDDLLAIGFYQTTTISNLNHNYSLIKTKIKNDTGNIHKFEDVVLIRTKSIDGKRIDF